MKTALILRHAKSAWDNIDLTDFERPLAKRGLNDAPRMGHVLADFNTAPDKILSSPAQRAKQTAELVAKACGYKKAIEWHDSFYGGFSDNLIQALGHLSNSIERVMLVGHNPTMEDTVATLLLGQEAKWNQGFEIKIPTAGLVCLDFDIMDWDDLEPGEAVLRWFLIPRLVKAMG